MNSKDNKQTNLDWLGFKRLTEIRKAKWLGGLLGAMLMLLAFVLFCAAVITLLDFLRAGLRLGPYVEDDDGSAIRNIGLVLAALFGAPFVIWRSYAAAQQARIQDESLFNDKINAASRDLSARRQTTRVVKDDNGTEVILTEWQDDLVTRAAAIDRLEGLAHERPDETPRIARMLSVYVRELSREFPAKEHPRQTWQRLIEPVDDIEPMTKTSALHHLGLSPKEVAIDALKSWAKRLQPIRSDMEKATQTLGRLKAVPGVERDDVSIDLRGANLQGFDLSALTFEKALFQEARMQGVDFSKAGLESAHFRSAHMEGADLFRAEMRNSKLDMAKMDGANLIDARLEYSMLFKTKLSRANLSATRLEGAHLHSTVMKGTQMFGTRFSAETTFSPNSLQGAFFHLVDLSELANIDNYLANTFGDGSVKLPAGIDWPKHWPHEELGLIGSHDQWRAFQRSIGYTPPD